LIWIQVGNSEFPSGIAELGSINCSFRMSLRILWHAHVSTSELLAAGASQTELASFLRDGADSLRSNFFPLALGWPMGFSWSSAVAQETLLCIAASGGLTSNLIWAPDRALPSSWELGFAVATDDIMIFSDGGPDCLAAPVASFEAALLDHGAIKHEGEDVDNKLNATCVGIDLVDGVSWCRRRCGYSNFSAVSAIWQSISRARLAQLLLTSASRSGFACYTGCASAFSIRSTTSPLVSKPRIGSRDLVRPLC
jgi:hypothetical protein